MSCAGARNIRDRGSALARIHREPSLHEPAPDLARARFRAHRIARRRRGPEHTKTSEGTSALGSFDVISDPELSSFGQGARYARCPRRSTRLSTKSREWDAAFSTTWRRAWTVRGQPGASAPPAREIGA